ncbi:MAG: OmpA family protein [Flavobacteriales bacterium]
MKRFKLTLFAAVFALTAGSVFAQNSNNKWLIGVGAHAVDHSSVRGVFDGFFDAEDDYSFAPPLSKLTIGRSLNKSFAVDLSASVGEIDYNRDLLKTGLDKVTLINDEFFINAGLGIKYKFANDYLLNETSWFDPYLRGGVNYTKYDYSGVYRAAQGSGSKAGEYGSGLNEDDFLGLSAGVGFNVWVTKNFGLNIESNYNMFPSVSRDYADFFQHSAGIVFRFGGKDSDKDGIPDNKDACPEVFGLKEFDGCPDTDGDKLIDSKDTCPELAGPIENNGCPDTDGDGVFDNVDNCVEVAGLADNNGCPWKDSDNDGILDKDDACPSEAGPANNNGCPIRDQDGDGVVDADDKCIDVPGPASNHGCPHTTTDVNAALRNLTFEYNSDKLTTESLGKVQRAATIMNNQLTGRSFHVDGYTDSKGSAAYNQKLSERRAKSVVAGLIKNGVDGSRLNARGFGEENPVATNETADGRAQNRRVVISFK